MTDVLKFIINQIAKFIKLSFSLKFDIFGFQLSVLHIELALFLIVVCIKFFTFGFSDTDGIKFKNKENKKEKNRKEQV